MTKIISIQLLVNDLGVWALAYPSGVIPSGAGHAAGDESACLGTTLTALPLRFEKEVEAALGFPAALHSYPPLPTGYQCCASRCGLQRRLGPALRGRAVRARCTPADLAFLIRDDADRALSPSATRRFAPVEFLALRTSHRRPAETQRSVLSSYSWPCGHLTPRPAVMQRFVLGQIPGPADIFGPDPPLPIPRICFL